jgi:hypothetical protein
MTESQTDRIKLLKKLLRLFRNLPGGGTLDYYSQGYIAAHNEFRKAIRDRIKEIENESE